SELKLHFHVPVQRRARKQAVPIRRRARKQAADHTRVRLLTSAAPYPKHATDHTRTRLLTRGAVPRIRRSYVIHQYTKQTGCGPESICVSRRSYRSWRG